jgi:hypothetical protein
MSPVVAACQIVRVHAYRGNRSRSFSVGFKKRLDDAKLGIGPGPSMMECLLSSGHTGVSTDFGVTIYGFNPDTGTTPIWQVMDLGSVNQQVSSIPL